MASSNFKEQTFWNNFMKDETMEKFKGWVGESEAESKVFFYDYLKNKEFKRILDVGCGNATVYDGLNKRNIDIEYVGVDSCDYFINLGTQRNINMIKSDIRKIDKEDSSYDLVFGRHVVEHQSDFETLFNEMIRLGKKECIHIFFIKPSPYTTRINYDPRQDLYHNTYGESEITSFLDNHPKVKNYYFININVQENMLVMDLQ